MAAGFIYPAPMLTPTATNSSPQRAHKLVTNGLFNKKNVIYINANTEINAERTDGMSRYFEPDADIRDTKALKSYAASQTIMVLM